MSNLAALKPELFASRQALAELVSEKSLIVQTELLKHFRWRPPVINIFPIHALVPARRERKGGAAARVVKRHLQKQIPVVSDLHRLAPPRND